MTVYAVLFWLTHRALLKLTDRRGHDLWVIAIAICLCYALTDEFHQSLTPNRYPTLRDVGFDMVGVTVALLKKYNYI